MDELPERRLIDVVGAVLLRDGAVLVARRSQDMSLPGLWEFPGGKIKRGESPQEALQRELSEELLIDAEIGEHVTTAEYEYSFGVVRLTTFFASLPFGEPRLVEHSEIRWVRFADLSALSWAPADLPTVEILISHDNPANSTRR